MAEVKVTMVSRISLAILFAVTTGCLNESEPNQFSQEDKRSEQKELQKRSDWILQNNKPLRLPTHKPLHDPWNCIAVVVRANPESTDNAIVYSLFPFGAEIEICNTNDEKLDERLAAYYQSQTKLYSSKKYIQIMVEGDLKNRLVQNVKLAFSKCASDDTQFIVASKNPAKN